MGLKVAVEGQKRGEEGQDESERNLSSVSEEECRLSTLSYEVEK